MKEKIEIIGSGHAMLRAEERLDCKGAKAHALFERAWQNGKSSRDYADGKSRRYLEKRSKNGNIAKCFGNVIYIFDDKLQECVTLFKAPFWFGQTSRKRFYASDEDLNAAFE